MKEPERFPADDPREWMNRARSSLSMAKNRVPQVYLEDLCFEAQQAAEKAVKALLIKRGIDFPYVHDLARLLSLPCSRKQAKRSRTPSDRPESSLGSPQLLATL